MQILGHIFKQSNDKNLKKTILITVWSVSALVLTSCFSGGVLQSIVNRRTTSLDTIEDLVNKNITIAIRYKTWVWWNFNNNRKYKIGLDNNMIAIKHLVKGFNNTDIGISNKVTKI